MQLIDFRDAPVSPAELLARLPRASLDITRATEQVLPLITEVREQGVTALRAHASRFDGVAGHTLRVPPEEITRALDTLDDALRDALEELARRLRLATEAQVPPRRVTELGDGARITLRWQPVSRVGLYVPGGKAVYPSSVMMNVIAAQVAGVSSIAITSPVQADSGGVHPTILAAAGLLGVDEVYAIGGASGIAALAYGVEDLGLEPVDVITGPGNIYVAAAKRAVSGQVGIDAEAGTTEILIIADDTAQPQVIAADLLSQAEHDEAAASVLVTTSEWLAQEVQTEVAEQVSRTLHRERALTALSGPQSAIILVDSLAEATRVSNSYAPEHLEIHTHDNDATLKRITNAGAIFLGTHTPVSLGDYLAGSNHVLPTGGTARFASGLGAHTFLRPQQIVEYDAEALSASVDAITTLAHAEGLPAHADAVWARFASERER